MNNNYILTILEKGVDYSAYISQTETTDQLCQQYKKMIAHHVTKGNHNIAVELLVELTWKLAVKQMMEDK